MLYIEKTSLPLKASQSLSATSFALLSMFLFSVVAHGQSYEAPKFAITEVRVISPAESEIPPMAIPGPSMPTEETLTVCVENKHDRSPVEIYRIDESGKQIHFKDVAFEEKAVFTTNTGENLLFKIGGNVIGRWVPESFHKLIAKQQLEAVQKKEEIKPLMLNHYSDRNAWDFVTTLSNSEVLVLGHEKIDFSRRPDRNRGLSRFPAVSVGVWSAPRSRSDIEPQTFTRHTAAKLVRMPDAPEGVVVSTTGIILSYRRSCDDNPSGELEFKLTDSFSENAIAWRHTRTDLPPGPWFVHEVGKAPLKITHGTYSLEIDIKLLNRKSFKGARILDGEQLDIQQRVKDETGDWYWLIPDMHHPLKWYYLPEKLRIRSRKIRGEVHPDFALLRYFDEERNPQAQLDLQFDINEPDHGLEQRLATRLLYRSEALANLTVGKEPTAGLNDPFKELRDQGVPFSAINSLLKPKSFRFPLSVEPLPILETNINLQVGEKKIAFKSHRFLSKQSESPPGHFSAKLTGEEADLVEEMLKPSASEGNKGSVNAYGIFCEFELGYETRFLFTDYADRQFVPDPFELLEEWLGWLSVRSALHPLEQDLLDILCNEYKFARESGFKHRFDVERDYWERLQSLSVVTPDPTVQVDERQLLLYRMAVNYLLQIYGVKMRDGSDQGEFSNVWERANWYARIDARSAISPSLMGFLTQYRHIERSELMGFAGFEIVEESGDGWSSRRMRPKKRDVGLREPLKCMGILPSTQIKECFSLFEGSDRKATMMLASQRVHRSACHFSLDDFDTMTLSRCFMPKPSEQAPAGLVLPSLEQEEKWGLDIDVLEISPRLEFDTLTTAQQSLASSIVDRWNVTGVGQDIPIEKPSYRPVMNNGELRPNGVLQIQYPTIRWTKSEGWTWLNPKTQQWTVISRSWVTFSLDPLKQFREQFRNQGFLNARYVLTHSLHHSSDKSTWTMVAGAEEKVGVPLSYEVNLPAFSGNRSLPYPRKFVSLVTLDPSELAWSQLTPGSMLEQVEVEMVQDGRRFRSLIAPNKSGQNYQKPLEPVKWVVRGGESYAAEQTIVYPTINYSLKAKNGDVAIRPADLNQDAKLFSARYVESGRKVVLTNSPSDFLSSQK